MIAELNKQFAPGGKHFTESEVQTMSTIPYQLPSQLAQSLLDLIPPIQNTLYYDLLVRHQRTKYTIKSSLLVHN